MRTTVIALMFVALVTVACSDRVPAPTTPTPTPRPGYPPAALADVPEGVLFVSRATSQPHLFGLNSRGEWEEFLESSSLRTTSPDGTRAALVTFKGNWPTGMGLLTASSYNEAAAGPWSTGSPMTVWSGDGKRLAYTVPDDAAGGKVHVWTLDADTGATRQLTTEPDFYSLLGWTAADEVLVSAPDGLALLGDTQRAVPSPGQGDIVNVEMSPDGRSLAIQLGEYEYRPEDSLTLVHSDGIWVEGLTGDGWREVLDLTGEPPGVQSMLPAAEMQWSPDGRRISTHLTQMDDDGLIGDRLIVLDVETSKETLVHEQGWGLESWSPDGRFLAYWYEGNAEAGQPGRQLGILGPDGRTRVADAHPSSMDWAGNGRLLLDIPGTLGLLDPETMEITEVLTEDGKTISVDFGVWSPSGRYVVAETPGDQYHRSSLYVVDTEEGTAELFLEEAGFSAVAWLRE